MIANYILPHPVKKWKQQYQLLKPNTLIFIQIFYHFKNELNNVS
jgi:hypothetical protein